MFHNYFTFVIWAWLHERLLLHSAIIMKSFRMSHIAQVVCGSSVVFSVSARIVRKLCTAAVTVRVHLVLLLWILSVLKVQTKQRAARRRPMPELHTSHSIAWKCR